MCSFVGQLWTMPEVFVLWERPLGAMDLAGFFGPGRASYEKIQCLSSGKLGRTADPALDDFIGQLGAVA